jgi:hypothetical protein
MGLSSRPSAPSRRAATPRGVGDPGPNAQRGWNDRSQIPLAGPTLPSPASDPQEGEGMVGACVSGRQLVLMSSAPQPWRLKR